MNDLSTAHTSSASRRQACVIRLWQGGFTFQTLLLLWWYGHAHSIKLNDGVYAHAYVHMCLCWRDWKKKRRIGGFQTIFCIFIQHSQYFVYLYNTVSQSDRLKLIGNQLLESGFVAWYAVLCCDFMFSMHMCTHTHRQQKCNPKPQK